MVLNRWFNHARRVFGFGYWSLAGYVKWKVKRAVMYVSDFESAVAHEANRRGMDGVICGHIHKAELRPIGALLYGNGGDWVESCTALTERADGSLALLTFAGQEQPVLAEPHRDLAATVS
jgi:UDP-2,3-diacylglucosamine pyrophosphatase LpxH